VAKVRRAADRPAHSGARRERHPGRNPIRIPPNGVERRCSPSNHGIGD
jgi:hypothetical protein